MKHYKLIILGKGGIGKSELVKQFVKPDKRFMSVYDPTIMDQYHKNESIDNKLIPLEIIDIGGFGQFQDNPEERMRNCDGFLLAYAIDDSESFRELSEIRNQIIQMRDPGKTTILIVGTKHDLGDVQRKVSVDQVSNLAKRWDCAYIETSAKTNYNVTEAFHIVVKNIIRLQTAQNARESSFFSCCPSGCAII